MLLDIYSFCVLGFNIPQIATWKGFLGGVDVGMFSELLYLRMICLVEQFMCSKSVECSDCSLTTGRTLVRGYMKVQNGKCKVQVRYSIKLRS